MNHRAWLTGFVGTSAVFLLAVMALVSCSATIEDREQQSQTRPRSELVIETDHCVLYRAFDGYRYVYLAAGRTPGIDCRVGVP